MKIIPKHVKRQKILFMIMQIIIKIIFLSSSIKTYKFANKPCCVETGRSNHCWCECKMVQHLCWRMWQDLEKLLGTYQFIDKYFSRHLFLRCTSKSIKLFGQIAIHCIIIYSGKVLEMAHILQLGTDWIVIFCLYHQILIHCSSKVEWRISG